MRCRRCVSTRVLKLAKKLLVDNDVYRCQECGFIYSPPGPLGGPASKRESTAEPSRTVTIRSGYRDRD